MKSKSAQSALELMILVGVSLLFLTLFLLSIQERTASKVREDQTKLMEEVAYSVQDEINLAYGAGEGYARTFTLPEKIGSQDYSLQVVDNLIYIKTDDGKNAIALPVQKFQGNLIKGANTIKKLNGYIQLN